MFSVSVVFANLAFFMHDPQHKGSPGDAHRGTDLWTLGGEGESSLGTRTLAYVKETQVSIRCVTQGVQASAL